MSAAVMKSVSALYGSVVSVLWAGFWLTAAIGECASLVGDTLSSRVGGPVAMAPVTVSGVVKMCVRGVPGDARG
jgi:hypothetical protein